jgi:hypothetical protein
MLVSKKKRGNATRAAHNNRPKKGGSRMGGESSTPKNSKRQSSGKTGDLPVSTGISHQAHQQSRFVMEEQKTKLVHFVRRNELLHPATTRKQRRKKAKKKKRKGDEEKNRENKEGLQQHGKKRAPQIQLTTMSHPISNVTRQPVFPSANLRGLPNGSIRLRLIPQTQQQFSQKTAIAHNQTRAIGDNTTDLLTTTTNPVPESSRSETATAASPQQLTLGTKTTTVEMPPIPHQMQTSLPLLSKVGPIPPSQIQPTPTPLATSGPPG